MVKHVSSISLEKAIKAYIELTNHEFTFVLAHGKEVNILDLVFTGENFVHFLGLHYLTENRIKSKKLFDKFVRKFKANKPINQVTEFNEFLKFDYDTVRNKNKCDVEKRLNLVIDLFNNLMLAEKNIYCKMRKNNKVATMNYRNITFDFAIEFNHQNSNYNRVFFFMSKDDNSVNPIAYNPVSVIDEVDDYLEGHIPQSLAVFENKGIKVKNYFDVQQKFIY